SPCPGNGLPSMPGKVWPGPVWAAPGNPGEGFCADGAPGMAGAVPCTVGGTPFPFNPWPINSDFLAKDGGNFAAIAPAAAPAAMPAAVVVPDMPPVVAPGAPAAGAAGTPATPAPRLTIVLLILLITVVLWMFAKKTLSGGATTKGGGLIKTGTGTNN